MSDLFNNSESYSLSAGEVTAVGKLMRNVYLWMTLALAITALAAFAVASNSALVAALYGSNLVWLLLVGEFVLVWVLASRIDRMSFRTAAIMFVIYSLLNGVVLSSIFFAYSAQAITSAFLVCSGTFAGMALVGTFTKKDLSGLGRILIMALIGLIVATLVNFVIYFISPATYNTINMIISVVGVLLFTGLTAYDAQKIKNMLHDYGYEVNDATQKIALMGSLTLYLDFINLFLYLLRLFGRRD